MSILVSAMTTESPFILTEQGIFFRSADGWGIEIKRGSRSQETVDAVLQTLNKAWKAGFSEGVEAGKRLNTTNRTEDNEDIKAS